MVVICFGIISVKAIYNADQTMYIALDVIIAMSRFRRVSTVGTRLTQASWWRHQMETFSALPALCAGNSPVTAEFSAQRPVTQSFVVIFFRGCVSEMVVLSYSVIYYIYIPGTLGPCFCKWSDTLWPIGRVRLFADYTISLSSLCRLIWRHWTTKMLVRYMMPSVCV